MKWIKRVMAVIVVIVLLFIIAAVVLVATFDPNDYKQHLEAAVEKSTGRELTLKGDINLTFFPWLGLKLGAARLSNAKGFGKEPFASVENAQVRIALLPLFHGEVRADTVKLQGLELNLIKNAKGETNWEDLIKPTGKQAPPKQVRRQQPVPNLALAVGGIRVEDAAVHWRDAQSHTNVRIAPIDLTTGALAFGKPFDIDLMLHLENAQPAVKADVNLNGEATINPKPQHYKLADVNLTVNAKGEHLPKAGVETTLNTAMEADLQAGTATVQPLTLQVADLQLTGQIDATGLNAKPQIQGELNSNVFSPRKLLKTLGQKPPPTRDPNVLNKANVRLSFNATPESAKLSGFEMQLDDTRVTGQGAVYSFNDPKVTLTAALDGIDLDRYRPPELATQPAPTGKPAPPANDNLRLPVKALRDLYLDGHFTAGKLKASGLNLTDVNAIIAARDGMVKITPLSMNLYQGRLNSNATLDVRGDTPKFTVNSALDGVQAGALLTEFAGDNYLTGTTRLNLNLNTQGATMSALKQALNGNLAASLKQGSIANSELAGRIARVVAFFKGQPDTTTENETRFSSLTGSAQIINGVLTNKNLALISPKILVKGQGSVNIPQAILHYTLNVALNDAGKPKDNRYVPIEVTGPFSELNYQLALADVVKEQAEQALKQKEQEVKSKLQEKLQEELKNRFNF
ncbi:MAG: AsmA family protein [Pseudomonadota bacterium]|nr:AsmA family protein [Pseudomonadota bacterium]